jgi:hypothetical protein
MITSEQMQELKNKLDAITALICFALSYLAVSGLATLLWALCGFYLLFFKHKQK